MAPGEASVLVRGEISDDVSSARLALLPGRHRDVVGIYADPVIETSLTCGGTPPVGTWQDVARLLDVTRLRAEGYDGTGVALAVCDTGINADHVTRQLGREITIDADRSWNPGGVTGKAGSFAVDHGTMCAFDTQIAAPGASLIDIPVLLSRRQGGTAIDGLLSDAVAAFAHLRTVLEAQPAASRALVISNSWGSFSPEWDLAPGSRGTTPTTRPIPSTSSSAAWNRPGPTSCSRPATAGPSARTAGAATRAVPSWAPTPTRRPCRSAGSTPTASGWATPRRGRGG